MTIVGRPTFCCSRLHFLSASLNHNRPTPNTPTPKDGEPVDQTIVSRCILVAASAEEQAWNAEPFGPVKASRISPYLASASRLVLAQALFRATAFMGGPPAVPQAQGPSVLASVMQEQDFVFRQLHT